MRSRQKRREKKAMLQIAGSADEARAKGQLDQYKVRHRAWKSAVCQFQSLDKWSAVP